MKLIQIITPEECRAARALLNWNARDLVSKTEISHSSVANFENSRLPGDLRRSRYFRMMETIIKTFNNEGIFFSEEEDYVAIKMRKKPACEN